ncbi:MAG: hypothetical protein Cons2KO_30420 [Congregibacter sp.]
MPAMPGSGKSTLAACLVADGWRLLSDEFGIVDLMTQHMLPMPRPIPLKNESIKVFIDRETGLSLGPEYDRTRKGTVRHVFPKNTCVDAQQRSASPALLLLPKYFPGADLEFREEAKHVALTRLTNNAFNYLVAGRAAFEAATNLVSKVQCYDMVYSDVDQAISRISEMVRDQTGCIP